MPTKSVTNKVVTVLKDLSATEIPLYLRPKVLSLNIRKIYFFEDDFSSAGIYGNCVVTLNNGRFVDLQILPNNIEAVFQILSK